MKTNLISLRKSAVILLGAALIFSGCQQTENILKTSTSSKSLSDVKQKTTGTTYHHVQNEYMVEAKNGSLAKASADLVKMGADILSVIADVELLHVHSTSTTFMVDAAKKSSIKTVTPNYEVQFVNNEMSEVAVYTGISGTNPVYEAGLQWGHRAINSEDAWNAGYTGEGAVVAVLDGGFYPDHPDIKDNVIDKMNFYPGETVEMPGDQWSHGTHVAGIIAAADNDVGGLGVAPDADLVLVKVLSNAGSAPFSVVLEGMMYAANRTDVHIMNMSLGGSIPLAAVPPQEQRYFRDFLNWVNKAVQYSNKMGKLVIIAAGNDGVNPQKDGWLITPAQAPQAFSVSALGPNGLADDPTADLDVLAYYSNRGIQVVDVAGSGGHLDFGLYQAFLASQGADRRFLDDLILSSSGAADYYYAQGTSMACPQVAGVAALIVGKYGKMSPKALKTKLMQSADDLGKAGRDDVYGHGRVNAGKAVQ